MMSVMAGCQPSFAAQPREAEPMVTKAEGKQVLAAVAKWMGREWGRARGCGSCRWCVWRASEARAGRPPFGSAGDWCEKPKYVPVPSGRKARIQGTGPMLCLGEYPPSRINLDSRLDDCTQPVIFSPVGPYNWPHRCKRYVEGKVPTVVVHKLGELTLGIYPRSLVTPTKRPKYEVVLDRGPTIGWYREWQEARTAAEDFAELHDEHRPFDFYTIKRGKYLMRWAAD